MFLRRATPADVASVVSEGDVLSRRQDASSGGMSGRTEAVIVIAVVLGFFLCIGLLGTLLLRYLRIRYDEPKYVPGKYLKDKWRNWMPASEKKKRYSSSLQRRSIIPGEMSVSQLNVAGAAQPAAGATVDRHTSVRSTITLPAYTLHPRATESVIGRMGERAGDIIIEFPETAEEEEERRDQEMESLYQIRQARRDERTNREERARLRQEAQESGDQETLRALRQAAQAARRGDHLATQRSADDLIREHRERDRSRRVPAIDYNEVGVARLDGSRIRASSNASDNAPLLDAAASMGSGGRSRSDTADSSRSRSRTPARRFMGHLRNISQSSLRFTSSDDNHEDHSDDDDATPRPSGTRASSRMSMADLDDPSIPRTRSGRVVDPPRYEGADWEEVSLNTAATPREPERAATRDSPRQTPLATPPMETPPSYPWLPSLGPLPTIEITPFDVTSNSVS